MGEVVGQISEGYAADFVLYEGDPTSDLEVLAAPVEVYKKGETVLTV